MIEKIGLIVLTIIVIALRAIWPGIFATPIKPLSTWEFEFENGLLAR